MESAYDYESPVIQGLLDTDMYTREKAIKWTCETPEKQSLTDKCSCPSFSQKMDKAGKPLDYKVWTLVLDKMIFRDDPASSSHFWRILLLLPKSMLMPAA